MCLPHRPARERYVHADDDTLFDAWRAGDRRAADALVRRHAPMVRRFLERRIAGNIEDAVQNVWIAIAKSHESFQRRGPFRAYLLGVLRNTAYEAQRQVIRARRHDPIETHGGLEGGPDVDALLDAHVHHARLRSALDTLSGDTRRVIEFYYFDRMPARMVGQQLGVGENTARSRVRRATERLRNAMVSTRGEPPLPMLTG